MGAHNEGRTTKAHTGDTLGGGRGRAVAPVHAESVREQRRLQRRKKKRASGLLPSWIGVGLGVKNERERGEGCLVHSPRPLGLPLGPGLALQPEPVDDALGGARAAISRSLFERTMARNKGAESGQRRGWSRPTMEVRKVVHLAPALSARSAR